MIESIYILLLYFIVGFIHDSGTTIWYMTLESRKIILSGFVSASLTFMGYCVIAFMVLSPDFIPRLIAYAIGTWVGTSLTLHLRCNNDRYLSRFIYRLFKR